MFKIVLKMSVLVIVSVIFSCVAVDRTMLVVQGAVPLTALTQCLAAVPAGTQAYLQKGILELGVGDTEKEYQIAMHVTYPFIDVPLGVNPSFPNYGKVQTANLVTLEEIEFLIETGDELDARLVEDGVFDWDTLSAASDPTAVPLSVTTTESAGDLFAIAALPLTNLSAPPIIGDKSLLMIHAVVRATTQDGDRLESSVFHFPVELCNGCLSNPVCPNGTVSVGVLETPCVVGQDAPYFTCEVPGAVAE